MAQPLLALVPAVLALLASPAWAGSQKSAPAPAPRAAPAAAPHVGGGPGPAAGGVHVPGGLGGGGAHLPGGMAAAPHMPGSMPQAARMPGAAPGGAHVPGALAGGAHVPAGVGAEPHFAGAPGGARPAVEARPAGVRPGEPHDGFAREAPGRDGFAREAPGREGALHEAAVRGPEPRVGGEHGGGFHEAGRPELARGELARRDPRLGGEAALHTRGFEHAMFEHREARPFLRAEEHRDILRDRAFVARHEGDFHSRYAREFSARELRAWRRGLWRDEWHYGRRGWWYEVDDVWYPYPVPVWPYPAEVAPLVVYEAETVEGPALAETPQGVFLASTSADPQSDGDVHRVPLLPAAPSGYYKCDDPGGYFPDVPACGQPWELVAAAAPDGRAPAFAR